MSTDFTAFPHPPAHQIPDPAPMPLAAATVAPRSLRHRATPPRSDQQHHTAPPTLPPAPAPLRGLDHLAPWLRRDRPAAVTVLTDPAVAHQPVTTLALAQIARAGITARTLTLTDAGGLDAIAELAARLTHRELIVSIGGGTILDFAKLTALTAQYPRAIRYLTAPQRSGFVILPPSLGDHVRVLAIPTTLGTGSERGTVACFTKNHAKHLALGPCLRPVAALWAPEATATLPDHLIADGVLEALFRTVSPYAGDPTELLLPDQAVEALAARILVAGYEVAALRREHRPIPDELRLRIAEMSAESQLGHTNQGRNPYSVKCWAIANELSTTVNLPKMRTVSALWPVLWRRTLAGDTRLGSPHRIRRLWAHLRHGAAWLDPDPAQGLLQLIDEWHINRTVTANTTDIARAAQATIRAWGAGLPILAELSAADLRTLLAEATKPAAADTASVSAAVSKTTTAH
ncbi:iron-containing alcohol dehydrogenase [Streptomyces sp. TRM66268-LWL]|uniref:Iron-containing alcohol dehydrogenase n=1 Tax=Streptomyces polyasparticus TaxID=2767826 RepID=A0ABR7STR9_9ACTN|nr:daptide-type RiPP biosynthesis dehydogenase [Streptomyces polyasparticus]MBC9718881.1 iron-containing alcohol dehydrogenase [Streptomyces polyasparticus]